MAKITLEITEDMIKLISNFQFGDAPDFDGTEQQNGDYSIDINNLYGGDITFESIAYVLGRYDEHIDGTEEDPLGAKFPKEFEDYMWQLHGTIVENIRNIEEIVHQFCGRGGVTPGTYVCQSNAHIWKKL